MSISVKLKDIVEEMDMQFEESQAFLNKSTGQVVVVISEELSIAEEEESFEDFPDWQQEALEIAQDVIENFENYIELPTKYDINEYNIMEDFCFTLPDQRVQSSLLNSINGKGAFRRFKDLVINLNIEDTWYSYRDERLKQIAIDWCQSNNITYIE